MTTALLEPSVHPGAFLCCLVPYHEVLNTWTQGLCWYLKGVASAINVFLAILWNIFLLCNAYEVEYGVGYSEFYVLLMSFCFFEPLNHFCGRICTLPVMTNLGFYSYFVFLSEILRHWRSWICHWQLAKSFVVWSLVTFLMLATDLGYQFVPFTTGLVKKNGFYSCLMLDSIRDPDMQPNVSLLLY